jgi:sarcosine oxidase subunit delta
MEVFGTYPAQTLEPPTEITNNISIKRPVWKWKEFS